jgi:hypothetical protein
MYDGVLKCQKEAVRQDSFVDCEVSQSPFLSPLPGNKGRVHRQKEGQAKPTCAGIAKSRFKSTMPIKEAYLKTKTWG